MIALALMAVSPVVPHFGDWTGNVAEWIRDSDNDRTRADGGVLFKVIFDLEGKPNQCVIVERSGEASVEQLVCRAVFSRFRSKPSVGPDGQPIYAVFQRSAAYRFKYAPAPPPRMRPLTVTDTTGSLLPENDGQRLKLTVAVDKEGMVSTCVPSQWSAKKDIGFAQAACASLSASWTPAREVNASGDAIAYLGLFDVHFKRSEATTPQEP